LTRIICSETRRPSVCQSVRLFVCLVQYRPPYSIAINRVFMPLVSCVPVHNGRRCRCSHVLRSVVLSLPFAAVSLLFVASVFCFRSLIPVCAIFSFPSARVRRCRCSLWRVACCLSSVVCRLLLDALLSHACESFLIHSLVSSVVPFFVSLFLFLVLALAVAPDSQDLCFAAAFRQPRNCLLTRGCHVHGRCMSLCLCLFFFMCLHGRGYL